MGVYRVNPSDAIPGSGNSGTAAPRHTDEGSTVTKWAYEVDVGTISGEVEAPNEDEAMNAATTDALGKHFDAILSGTWGLRKVEE